jgi:hypothetical protein
MIHAYVVMCMLLNPTLCREQEIVPDDFHAIASPVACARGGIIYSAGGIIEINGVQWVIKGVRCKLDGSMLSLQMRAAFDMAAIEDDQTLVLDGWGVIIDRLERLKAIIEKSYIHRSEDRNLVGRTREHMAEIDAYIDRIDKKVTW